MSTPKIAAVAPKFITLPIDVAIAKFKSGEVTHLVPDAKNKSNVTYISAIFHNVCNYAYVNGKYEPKGAPVANARARIVYNCADNRISVSSGPVDAADKKNPMLKYDNKPQTANVTMRIDEAGLLGEFIELADVWWTQTCEKMSQRQIVRKMIRRTYSENIADKSLAGTPKEHPDFTVKIQLPWFKAEFKGDDDKIPSRLTKAFDAALKSHDAEDKFREKYFNLMSATTIRKADKTYFDAATKSQEYYAMIIDPAATPKARYPYRSNIHKVIARGSKVARITFEIEGNNSSFGLACNIRVVDIVIDNSEMQSGGAKRAGIFDDADLLGESAPVEDKPLTAPVDEDDLEDVEEEEEEEPPKPVAKVVAKPVAKPIAKAVAKPQGKKPVKRVIEEEFDAPEDLDE